MVISFIIMFYFVMILILFASVLQSTVVAPCLRKLGHLTLGKKKIH